MNDTKFHRYWRPAMGWSYLIVCLWDFLLAPLFFTWWAAKTKTSFEMWKPLTLAEGGLYHLAMGAIVGVTAWSRGQEKISFSNKTTASEEHLD